MTRRYRYGVGSDEWLQQLEELNSALKRLAERAPAWAALFVTADHGMVNVPEHQRIDYSGVKELTRNIAMTAGEPRAVHLYLEDTSEAARTATAQRWAQYWGERAWVIDSRELMRAGYFGRSSRMRRAPHWRPDGVRSRRLGAVRYAPLSGACPAHGWSARFADGR